MSQDTIKMLNIREVDTAIFNFQTNERCAGFC